MQQAVLLFPICGGDWHEEQGCNQHVFFLYNMFEQVSVPPWERIMIQRIAQHTGLVGAKISLQQSHAMSCPVQSHGS